MTQRNWCFTLNNPSEEEEEHLKEVEVGYIIFQLESGLNGTSHFQGYVQFKTRRSLLQCKRSLGERCHLEPARGSPDDNVAYCSKLDGQIRGPYVRGEISKPGERRDIQAFVSSVKEAKSDAELVDLHPEHFVRYHKAVDRIRNAFIVSRSWEMRVVVYWGPSGVGKTRRAVEEAGPSVYFVSKGDNNQPVWFDGYQGEETVIIDDFYGWLPWTFILRLLDRYPFSVQYKGGFRQFTSRQIFITSNVHPDKWYKNVPNDDITPLLRRINLIINMK